MFTKAISEGQLLSSSGVNTIMDDISGSWTETEDDRFVNYPNSTSAYGSSVVTHFYYLNPAGDVYIQLQRVKLSYSSGSLPESYNVISSPRIDVYYDVGGGATNILSVNGGYGPISGSLDYDLGAIPASTSNIATDPYIKVSIGGGLAEEGGNYRFCYTYYNNFRLQYTVSTSI